MFLEGRPGIYASERLVDDKRNKCFWQNGGLWQISKSSVLKSERYKPYKTCRAENSV